MLGPDLHDRRSLAFRGCVEEARPVFGFDCSMGWRLSPFRSIGPYVPPASTRVRTGIVSSTPSE